VWVFFYKDYRTRAAAERFNSECASSGEKVENPCADNRITQTGKDRGFNAIHCWPDTTLGNRQADAAGAAGDHSHGDGVGVVARFSGVSSGAVDGEGVVVDVIASVRFFFFFDRSVFPTPNRRLIILPRSRPTNWSIKFVLGLSTLPPTWKSKAK